MHVFSKVHHAAGYSQPAEHKHLGTMCIAADVLYLPHYASPPWCGYNHITIVCIWCLRIVSAWNLRTFCTTALCARAVVVTW